jgi:hypothetical protein
MGSEIWDCSFASRDASLLTARNSECFPMSILWFTLRTQRQSGHVKQGGFVSSVSNQKIDDAAFLSPSALVAG